MASRNSHQFSIKRTYSNQQTYLKHSLVASLQGQVRCIENLQKETNSIPTIQLLIEPCNSFLS